MKTNRRLTCGLLALALGVSSMGASFNVQATSSTIMGVQVSPRAPAPIVTQSGILIDQQESRAKATPLVNVQTLSFDSAQMLIEKLPFTSNFGESHRQALELRDPEGQLRILEVQDSALLDAPSLEALGLPQAPVGQTFVFFAFMDTEQVAFTAVVPMDPTRAETDYRAVEQVYLQNPDGGTAFVDRIRQVLIDLGETDGQELDELVGRLVRVNERFHAVDYANVSVAKRLSLLRKNVYRILSIRKLVHELDTTVKDVQNAQSQIHDAGLNIHLQPQFSFKTFFGSALDTVIHYGPKIVEVLKIGKQIYTILK